MDHRPWIGLAAVALFLSSARAGAQETVDFAERRRELTRLYDQARTVEEKRTILERMRALEILPPAPITRPAPPSPGPEPVFRAPLAARNRGAITKLVHSNPDAIAAATADERAAMIDLLQKGGTGDGEERAIESILSATPPFERAEVLRLVDLGDDKYDLDELVYHDIDDKGRRERILGLMDEAAAALEESGALEPGVISDIDDTALPRKNRPEDLRGAPLVYRYLEGGRGGDVHFVTARPPLVVGDMRGRLARAGFPPGTIEDGNLGRAIFEGMNGVWKEKVEDIERLLRLHPRQKFVLLGDDLDRDPEVFRTILVRHPDRIRGALVRLAGGKVRDTLRFPGIAFFGRYDEAAEELRLLDLIDSKALEAIRDEVDRVE